MPGPQISFAGLFPKKIWNFPGAYVVWFMTAVASSACVYTMVHYVKDSPDFAWRAEMRTDEDAKNEFLYARARQSFDNSFFRKLAILRSKEDLTKDTRIFR